MPCRSPKSDAQRSSVRGTSAQNTSSLRDGTQRCTLRPQTCGLRSLNRSCENGIQSSAVHPWSSIGGARLPDRVERVVVVELVVARVVVIEPHAGGRHAEGRRRAAIEVGVERDEQVLGLLALVAPSQRRLDGRCRHTSARRRRARHRRRRTALPCGRSAARPRSGSFCTKSVTGGTVAPRLFVEAAVDADRAVGDAHRARLFAPAVIGLRVLRRRAAMARARTRIARGSRTFTGATGMVADRHEASDEVAGIGLPSWRAPCESRAP